ncbi:MAG: hypothetical protein AB1942_25990 [Pseudomonadota bacterium]
MRRPPQLVRIFGVPALIAALSLFGLIAALIGDGPWDAAGWLGVFAPFAALVWTSQRRG